MTVNASYMGDKTYGLTSLFRLDDEQRLCLSYPMYRTWADRPVITNVNSEEELFDDDSDGNNSSTMNPILSSKNEDKVTRKQTFISNAKLDDNLHKNLRLASAAAIRASSPRPPSSTTPRPTRAIRRSPTQRASTVRC
ncbi:MAG: hypothetical protein V8Q54_08510 [Alistipes senegalensis]